MRLSLSSAAARAFVVFGAAALAFLLVYLSIRNAIAVDAAGLDTRAGYERAVRLESGNARNWYLLGRYWLYNLESPDPQLAIANFQKSISLDPRSDDAWLELATAYDEQGEIAEARRAFLSAQKAYPASADVAWRYGNFLLRQEELPAAFEQIRNAVQQDPKRGAQAFSRSWRAYPDAAVILDKVIPPSKDLYVPILQDLGNANQVEPALAVWQRLYTLHPQMSPREVYAFTDALQRAGRLSDLDTVWHQAVSMLENPPPPDPPGSVLWDGSFESAMTGTGFAWEYPAERSGVLANLDTSQKHSGNQSLRISFSGRQNVAYADACHPVLVVPGTSYRLSGWAHTQSLTSSEGIRFRVVYRDTAGNNVADTPDLRGTEPWTNLTLLWTAPAASRLVQVCIVRHAGGVDADIQGSAWVDDISLTPFSSSSPKTSPKK